MVLEQPKVRVARSRRLACRIGLVLAGVMAVFNVVNGAMGLIDPTLGQADADLSPQPQWISIALLLTGVTTLAALAPAWRGRRAALWTVIMSRLIEAWSAIILPFLPGAPEGMWPFIILLVVGGTVVAGLVALGLRR